MVEDNLAPVEIKIFFHPIDGRIDVSGPLSNKIFFLGLLELVKDRINNQVETKKKTSLLNFVRKQKGN